MAYVVWRCTYGGAVPDAKKKLIAAIARFVEILKTTAKISLDIEFKGPMKAKIVRRGGVPMEYEKDGFDDALFKELIEAEKFMLEFDVLSTRNIRGGWPSHVTFWYDEKENLDTSINVEFMTKYPGGVLSFKFFALIAVVNLPKLTGFRQAAEGMNDRIQKLWESVLRMYLGDTYTKTERKFVLRKYDPDFIGVHLFGKVVKIKEE